MDKATKGVYLALLTAFISGVSNFIMKIAVTNIKDPYLFTTIKNILVGLILVLIIASPWAVKKIKGISRANWMKLFFVGLIGGSIPFLLYFKGLSMTMAASASFIHKTLFIWVAILAVPFLKEKISVIQAGAFFLLIMANLMLLGPNGFRFGAAEGLCLLATIFWATENVIAKKVLAEVDEKAVAFARMFFGAIILSGFIFLTSGFSSVWKLTAVNWGWIALSSLLLLGYVLSWYAALKRESAVIVTSVLVLASPITSLLTMMLIDHSLSIKQVFVSFVMAMAVIFICGFRLRSEEGWRIEHARERS